MLILMKTGHTQDQIDGVVQRVKSMGFTAHIIPGEHDVAIGVTGNDKSLDAEEFTALPGVKDAVVITKPYKLVSRTFKKTETVLKVGTATFGAGHFTVIAGPCAVESEEQTLRIARHVKKAGANVLRGGAYKPRSSPYSFQGMGIDGLKILKAASQETGLPIVTEALDSESLEAVNEYADIIQIGARNMQNFSLLQEVGRLRKPVMLKRGMSATIAEWLQAAEYILSEGNPNVMLCERGVRSFDNHLRNMLDLAAVPALREVSHLPIVVDPSHGSGKKTIISALSRASLAVGAQAVMIDVHDRPGEALCDGPQAIHPDELVTLIGTLHEMAGVLQLQMKKG
jgi:3-deoxy-7-phosphoheptulonate synthase